MSRWILLPVHEMNVVEVEVAVAEIGGGATITEITAAGEIRIEDHVETEEIRIVGEVSNDNKRRRSYPKMLELNLWEGGMLEVNLEGEEVDL